MTATLEINSRRRTTTHQNFPWVFGEAIKKYTAQTAWSIRQRYKRKNEKQQTNQSVSFRKNTTEKIPILCEKCDNKIGEYVYYLENEVEELYVLIKETKISDKIKDKIEQLQKKRHHHYSQPTPHQIHPPQPSPQQLPQQPSPQQLPQQPLSSQQHPQPQPHQSLQPQPQQSPQPQNKNKKFPQPQYQKPPKQQQIWLQQLKQQQQQQQQQLELSLEQLQQLQLQYVQSLQQQIQQQIQQNQQQQLLQQNVLHLQQQQHQLQRQQQLPNKNTITNSNTTNNTNSFIISNINPNSNITNTISTTTNIETNTNTILQSQLQSTQLLLTPHSTLSQQTLSQLIKPQSTPQLTPTIPESLTPDGIITSTDTSIIVPTITSFDNPITNLNTPIPSSTLCPIPTTTPITTLTPIPTLTITPTLTPSPAPILTLTPTPTPTSTPTPIVTIPALSPTPTLTRTLCPTLTSTITPISTLTTNTTHYNAKKVTLPIIIKEIVGEKPSPFTKEIDKIKKACCLKSEQTVFPNELCEIINSDSDDDFEELDTSDEMSEENKWYYHAYQKFVIDKM